MDKKKHRHVFVIRILPRRSVDDHNEKYTGFLRIFFYDPTSRGTFLEFYDRYDLEEEKPFRIGNDEYLFSEFTDQDPDTGELFSQDYTHTKAYPLPSDKEYDPPEGIKLCAELNLKAYEKAFKAWNRFKDLYRNPPVSTRATGILNHYKRVVADCRQWYIENCPEYLPRLALDSTEASVNLPDKGRSDTVWIRKNKWPELRDRLYRDRKIHFETLLAAADDIPEGKPESLRDEDIFKSFCDYVNRLAREIQGKDSLVTAKVDHLKKCIVLSRKRKNK